MAMASTALASPALARDGAWYVGVEAGPMIVEDTDFDIGATGDVTSFDYDVGFDAGGFVIHGRSDATLNSGGVRIGTAEIYRVVDALADIEESIVVGQRDGLDTRIVLFVVLCEGANLDEELQQQIRQALRSAASPRHVPAEIVAVPSVPRTVTGKLAELAVTDIVNGDPVRNTSGLIDPSALEAFRVWVGDETSPTAG
jgi:acetoacetyl-CoA synthetase